ncbi:MAG: hypothetical protein V7K48_00490 [Nostoc sp.]|uniref:hypothetical protein n=1 Tax=Nostoc sp. TaxID=1180 RepID=UPI002FFB0FB1
MARLTVPPNFIGTPGTDILVGKELNTLSAIGIDILTGGFIRTRSGNDTIIGKGKGSGVLGDNSGDGGTGTGIINNGSLNAGDGEDTITGIGTGSIGGKLRHRRQQRRRWWYWDRHR